MFKSIARFFIRWAGRLLGIAGLVFVIQSFCGTYTAFTSRKQVHISCEDFIRERPDAKWLTIKDAKLDFAHTVVEKTFGKISQAYIPILPRNAPAGTSTPLVLNLKESSEIAMVETLDKPAQELEKLLEKQARIPGITAPIEGLVRHGLDDNDKERQKIQKLLPALPNDYVLVVSGEKPSFLGALAKLGYGILFFILSGICWMVADKLKKKNSPPPLPPVDHSVPPPIPPAVRN